MSSEDHQKKNQQDQRSVAHADIHDVSDSESEYDSPGRKAVTFQPAVLGNYGINSSHMLNSLSLGGVTRGIANVALGSYPTDARILHVDEDLASLLIGEQGCDPNVRRSPIVMWGAKRIKNGDVRVSFHTVTPISVSATMSESVLLGLDFPSEWEGGDRVSITLKALPGTAIHFGALTYYPPVSINHFGMSVPTAFASMLTITLPPMVGVLMGWMQYGQLPYKSSILLTKLPFDLLASPRLVLNGAFELTNKYVTHPVGTYVKAIRWSEGPQTIVNLTSTYFAFGGVVVSSLTPITIGVLAQTSRVSNPFPIVVDNEGVFVQCASVVKGVPAVSAAASVGRVLKYKL